MNVPLRRMAIAAAALALIGFGSRASAAEKKAKATPAAAAPAAPVDINTADSKTLAGLPGVGEKTAEAIIKGRPYKSVDDLAKVKGIGEKKLAKLRPLVTVGGTPAAPAPAPAAKAAPHVAPAAAAPAAPAPAARPAEAAAPKAAAKAPALAPGEKVNINTASKEELDRLPGIGPAKAQAILDYRAQHRFDTIEDIMKVKGIKEGEFGKIKDLITVR